MSGNFRYAKYGELPGNAAIDDPNKLADLDTDQIGAVAIIQGDGVLAPTTNLTAAVGSAGALTGTFYYTQTFVTAEGETAPWPGTPSGVVASSQRINLTNIPVSPSSKVLARNIYRSDGVTTEPKNYRYLATIFDNSTTTYTDNTAANSTTYCSWSASNRGRLRFGNQTVATFSDQTTSLGFGTFGNGVPGYASVAIGYNALFDNTEGRRNVAVGVYALENNTLGYENTAVGIHAGGGLVGVGAVDNTLVGYAAGGTNSNMGAFNVGLGAYSLSSVQTKGSNNTAIGSYALGSQSGGQWSNCIAVGYMSGRYSDASNQVFIDSRDRTNIVGCKDAGLMYGEVSATVSAQRLNINAFTRIGPPATTVAGLPAAAGLAGYKGFVTDANATTFASIVAGGGSNGVPVYCDGTNWRIGQEY